MNQFESFKNEINSNTYPFARIYQPAVNSSKNADIIIEGKIGMEYFNSYQDISWAYGLLMDYLADTDYYYRGDNNLDSFEIKINLVKTQEQLAYGKRFAQLKKDIEAITFVKEFFTIYDNDKYNAGLTVEIDWFNPEMDSNEKIQHAYDSIPVYLESKNIHYEVIDGRGWFHINFKL